MKAQSFFPIVQLNVIQLMLKLLLSGANVHVKTAFGDGLRSEKFYEFKVKAF